MKRFNYLLTLVFVFCVPAAVGGVFLQKHISLSSLVPFILFITIMGAIWDVWATRHSKRDRVWLWQFNRRQTIGLRLLGLPIEEFIFYPASGAYVVFMWEGIRLIAESGIWQAYILVLFMSVWTLFAVAIPYLFAPKGDRFIN